MPPTTSRPRRPVAGAAAPHRRAEPGEPAVPRAVRPRGACCARRPGSQTCPQVLAERCVGACMRTSARVALLCAALLALPGAAGAQTPDPLVATMKPVGERTFEPTIGVDANNNIYFSVT